MNVTNRNVEAALPWLALDQDWIQQVCTAGMQTCRGSETGERLGSSPQRASLHFLPLMQGGDISVLFPFLQKNERAPSYFKLASVPCITGESQAIIKSERRHPGAQSTELPT